MISFIQIAHAAVDNKAQIAAKGFVAKINEHILFPLIALMMALAFLYFLYGAFEYVKNANNQTARETGRRHLLYGVIGMLIMLSAFAILNIAAGTFGLEKELKNANDPITTLAPTGSRRPTTRPDFNAAGYVPDNSLWNGDTADSFGGDSGHIPLDDTPPDVISDFEIDGFETSPDVSYTLPDISQGSDAFSPPVMPPRPLSPQEELIFEEFVDTYAIEKLPHRTESLNAQDRQNILNEYASFGVTEILFMTDMASMTGTRSSAPALSQQEALCEKQGGSLTLESGVNKVTSRSMYICLR